jgi:hypothetical protein
VTRGFKDPSCVGEQDRPDGGELISIHFHHVFPLSVEPHGKNGPRQGSFFSRNGGKEEAETCVVHPKNEMTDPAVVDQHRAGRSVGRSRSRTCWSRTHRARSGCSGSADTLYASWSSGRETLTSGELSLGVLDLSGLDQVER